MTKRKPGGARDGAGRKPIRKGIAKTVILSLEHWHVAKGAGDGNMTRGIRRALDLIRGAKHEDDIKETKH